MNNFYISFIGLLHELIGYELQQGGLNLSHSQDRYFIKHLVESAGVILDRRYADEWLRLTQLTQRRPTDLIDAFHKYQTVLARSQHDTYTSPFEIVHANMALGLDIVTAESLFGYELQQQLNQQQHYRAPSKSSSPTYTTESVILPDTSAFLQHSAKQKALISFPKYNNYLQSHDKFDRITKVQVPLDILGITPPDRNEVTNNRLLEEYRAIVSYAQYKDVGHLGTSRYDETVTRRWGVDIQIATPIFSLAILVPSTADDDSNNSVGMNQPPSASPSPPQLPKLPTGAIGEPKEMPSENDVELIRDHKNKQQTTNGERHQTHGDIKIFVHDLDKNADQTIASVFDDDQQPFEELPVPIAEIEKKGEENVRLENDATYTGERWLDRRRRDLTSIDVDEKKPTVYRSIGSPHLSQPIKLQMWINVDRARFGPRSNPQCVRWNEFTASWTRIGCQTQLPDYETMLSDVQTPLMVNCSCNHVSHYAVLVDVIDPEYMPEPSLLVQITSFSAFMLSLPILGCVLIALGLLRGMQTNSNTIHQNLVICVFCAELLFFIGMQSRRELVDNEFPCKIIAICLHYCWLSAFAWTTVDCIHLYRMLTEMRDINHGPMGFYFSVGYGAPAVVVGLSVGVRAHEYGNSML